MSHDANILTLITNNPYRILGVFANAPKKEILTNINKLRAFSKVGKSTIFPSDFPSVLGEIHRTIDAVDQAEKAIERPIDKLKASFFWFFNITPFDNIAFNHLYSGDMNKAVDIWTKKECISSLINLSLCSLIRNDYTSAAFYVDTLIQKYSHELCNSVNETISLSQQELMELYLETLTEIKEDALDRFKGRSYIDYWPLIEFAKLHGRMKVTNELTNPETNEKFRCCAFVDSSGKVTFVAFGEKLGELKPDEIAARKAELMVVQLRNEKYVLVSKIGAKFTSQIWRNAVGNIYYKRLLKTADEQIYISKKINKSQPEKRLEFGQKLVKLASEILPKIQEIKGDLSIEYSTLADKFATEILQCGIDYHNNTAEEDEEPELALNLQETALQLAKGELIKDRCQENVDILRNIIKQMPPKSVRYYHRLLKARLDAYQDEPSTILGATKFILDCAPYLMSIRSALGKANEYYTRMSTRVADDAISDVISDYNTQSETFHKRFESANNSSKSEIINNIKELIKSALIALYKIKSLDVSKDFRERRLNPNYQTIFNQAAESRVLGNAGILGLFGGSVPPDELNRALLEYKLDERDEDGYFKSIKSSNDCYAYRRIFPDGKHQKAISAKVEEFEYKECSTLEDLASFKVRYPNTKYNLAEKREDIIFYSCKTISDYNKYLAYYTKYKDKAYARIDDLTFSECKSKDELLGYLKKYPNGIHLLEAQRKIDDIDYRTCKVLADYEKYVINYPNGSHLGEAKKRIEEEKLWAQCQQKKSWKLFKEYVTRFPQGRYLTEAKKKAISPKERFKKWSSENGCLLTIIIVVLIVLLIAAITHGVYGIGCIFGFIAFGGICVAGGKGDIGCGARIAGILVAAICGLISYGLMELGESIEKENKAKSALDELGDMPTVQEYRSFFSKQYDNIDQEQKDKLAKKYYQASLDSCYTTLSKYSAGGYDGNTLSGLGYLKDYINQCYNSTYNDLAKQQYNAIVDSLYSVALDLNTYDGWQAFQSAVSAEDFRDSDEMLDATDPSWKSEASAWQTASTQDNIAGYEKYMMLYPNGKHKAVADKKLIDLTVSQTFAGDHGSLPSMDRTSYGGGTSTSISVYNNTEYTMTLLYSGTDSKRLVISPRSRGTLYLKNGSYRIAASVNASNVSNYAGSETLDGGSYEVEYYISTTTVPSYRYH